MITNKLIRGDLFLLLLFLAISATILLRAYADETGYTTADSEYYLELAENLTEGNGFYMSNEYPIPVEKTPQNQVPFTAWPVGYPILIALTSLTIHVNVFWASKILNLFLLAMGFLLLRRIDRTNAYLLAGAYATYTLLAVYTYTWSEAPFNLGLLLFVYLLCQLLTGNRVNRTILLLFLTAMFLFLMRYIGVLSFGILALAAGFFWRRGLHSTSIKLIVASFSPCLLAALYFGVNHYFTGSFSGGDRLAGHEAVDDFIYKQTLGIVNEFFLIRKHYAPGPPDTLFWLVLATQATAIGAVALLLNNDKHHVYFKRQHTQFPRLCFLVAGLYFMLLFFLRTLSPFDPLDFRLLSPSVFLILIALLYYVSILPEIHKHKAIIKSIIMSFFLLSLLLNLPKHFIIEKMMQLLP